MKITAEQLRENYQKFFEENEHKRIPSSSVIPENDATVLFTTAGMQPLVPYLMGESHPSGNRITDVQKCLRTGDIEEVGDTTHHTFFEMLGNWSLGSYFKQESIEMSFKFLIEVLNLPLERLAFSVFEGDEDVPRDEESLNKWLSLGVPKERIACLDKEENWWPAGGKSLGPQGPDTEIFYWKRSDVPAPEKFDPEDDNWVEIWNNVFMQFERKKKKYIIADAMNCLIDPVKGLNRGMLGMLKSFDVPIIIASSASENSILPYFGDDKVEVFSSEMKPSKSKNEFYELLLKQYNVNCNEVLFFDDLEINVSAAKSAGIKSLHFKQIGELRYFLENNLFYYADLEQKNVDTGMGLERTVAILNGMEDNYLSDVFAPIIAKISEITGVDYTKADDSQVRSMRIIADHIRTAVIVMGDRYGVTPSNTDQGYVLRRLIRRAVREAKKLGVNDVFTYQVALPVFEIYEDVYPEILEKKNFVLENLSKEEEKFLKTLEKGLKEFEKMVFDGKVAGKQAFDLFATYGFPVELTQDLARERNFDVDMKAFDKEFKAHQDLSRLGAEQKFKGGLADDSEECTRLHTATHLLHQALKNVLGADVECKGSNITPDRLRFDFEYPEKLNDEQKNAVEVMVNEQINRGLDVSYEEMTVGEAKTQGAIGLFEDRYGEKVKVYRMGDFSLEICGGPHVNNTKDLVRFKIKKEESSSAGVRRIKAVLIKE